LNPATQKLRTAKKISLWAAIGLAVFVAGNDVALALNPSQHEPIDRGLTLSPLEVLMAVLTLGLIIFLLVTVVASVLAWARFFAANGHRAAGEPLSGSWSRMMLVNLALCTLVPLFVGDFTGFFFLLAILCVLLVARAIRKQRHVPSSA
jgi:hypothetical protein